MTVGFFLLQAEDGIRDKLVTGVQTCALPICYDENNMLTRGQEIAGELDEARATHMPLATGEMSIHNYRLAHASGPNVTDDRRIGISMHFMPPDTGQIVGDWDSAALVRGEDRFGNFARPPIPSDDMDAEAVAFHVKASQAIRDALYADAAENKAQP